MGWLFFASGSSILRTRVSHENKHLVLLGKVVYVWVYEVTRDQGAGLV